MTKKNAQELPPAPGARLLQTPVPASKKTGQDAEGSSLPVDDATSYEEFLQTQQFRDNPEIVDEPSSGLLPIFPDEPDLNDHALQPSAGLLPIFPDELEVNDHIPQPPSDWIPIFPEEPGGADTVPDEIPIVPPDSGDEPPVDFFLGTQSFHMDAEEPSVVPIAPPIQEEPPAPAMILPHQTPSDAGGWQVGQIVDGRYEVKRIIGRGGMGIVYQVYHREWDLDLAVKMPLPQLVANPALKARFLLEAQTWVDLGLHPNIVQCWYVREFDGLPRVFMDYLEGGSLKDWMKGGEIQPGDWDLILNLLIQACDGLGYAHTHGVKVHRDVKPANMLMTKEGELRVTDFGIAKRSGREDEELIALVVEAEGKQHTVTMTGFDLGTPEYGAPEQWGEAKYADARADIYALGGVMFELCCGRRAFDDGRHREQPHAMIGRHLFSPAPDPREFNPDVPQVLAELILKCLAKTPDGRPNSMGILREKLVDIYAKIMGKPYWKDVPEAAELRSSLLNNKAVSLLDLGKTTEAFTAFEEALKLDAHHPESVYNKSLLEWRQEKIADDEVVRRLREASQTSPRANVYLGYIHLERAAADEAAQAIQEALQTPEIANESSAWRALGDSLMAQENYHDAEEAYQKAMELLPGDALLAHKELLARSHTRWQDEQRLFPFPRCLKSFTGYSERTEALSLTPDGRFAVMVGNEGVKFWDLLNGIYPWSCTWAEEKRGFWTFKGYAGSLTALALTPDGRFALTGGSYDSRLRLWELATGACVRTFSGHTGDITAVAVTPDGRYALSGSIDMTARLWEIATGVCVLQLEGQHDVVSVVGFTPDGQYGMSGGRDLIRLWELQTGKYIRSFRGHNDDVTSLAMTRDGQMLVSGSRDKTVRVWKLTSGRCLHTLMGHTAIVTAVAITPDGNFAISASLDRTIKIWSVATGECLRTLKGHESAITSIALTPDGEFVMSGGRDRTLRLWRVATGKCFRVYQEHTHWIEALAFTADGQSIIFGNQEEIRVKNLATETEPQIIKKYAGGNIEAMLFAKEGASQRLADAPGSLKILPPGETFWTVMGRDPARTLIAASSDGRYGISGGDHETLWLWELPSKTCIAVFRGPHGFQVFKKDRSLMRCLTMTPDQRYALSNWYDSSLRLWDLATGVIVRIFEGHEQGVLSVAITPDGRFALSGSSDLTVRLWEVATGLCLRTLKGHKESVLSVALTPDGRFAVSGSSDHTIRLWNVTTGKCLRTFEGHGDSVTALTLTADGQFALSANQDRGVHLWRLDAAVPRYQAALQVCRHLGHWELEQLRRRFRRFLDRVRSAHQAGKTATAYTFLVLARSIPGYERDPEALALNAVLSERLQKKTLRHGRLFGLLDGHESTVTALVTSMDGHLALSGSQDRTVRLWGVATRKALRTFQGHRDHVTCVALTPDRHLVLSGSWDKTVRLWALATGESLKVFHEHEDYVKAVAISPDGRFALSGGCDHSLRLWSLVTEKYHKIFEGVHIPLEDAYKSAELTSNNSLRVFRGHTDDVEAVAFLPNGQLALSASRDKTLRLWHLTSGRCLRIFNGHADYVTSLTISADGRSVASASRDGTLRLWHIATGTCLRVFHGHANAVTSVAMTSDSRFLFSGGWDKTIRLWRVTTGECLRTFERHEEPIESATITPDGHFALSGGRDKTIRIWEFDWELGPEKPA